MTDENNITDIIETIIQGSKDIMEGKKLSLSQAFDIHQKVYNYYMINETHYPCIIKQTGCTSYETCGFILYSYLKDLLNIHFKVLKKSLGHISKEFFRAYLEEWKKAQTRWMTLNTVFNYFTRNFTNRFEGMIPDVCGVPKLVVIRWTECVYKPNRKRIYAEILYIIEQERNKKIVDMRIVRSLCEHLKILTTANKPPSKSKNDINNGLSIMEDFKQEYIKSMTAFYEGYCAANYPSMTTIEILDFSKAVMTEEINWIDKYLLPTIGKEVSVAIDKICVFSYATRIYEDVKELIEISNTEGLRNIYDRVCEYDDIVEELIMIFHKNASEYIATWNKNYKFTFPVDYIGFVQEISRIFSRYNTMVNQGFDYDYRLIKEKDFIYFKWINELLDRSLIINGAILLTESLNAFVIGCFNKLSIRERQILFDDLFYAISYVQNVKLLKSMATKLLTERLIKNANINIDMEYEVISNFEKTFGDEFVSEMKMMLDQISESNNYWEEYKIQHRIPSSSIFTTLVLSSFYLPNDFFAPSELPTEFKIFSENFQKWYTKLHKTRRLRFFNQLARVELEISFRTRTYTFEVCGFQATILLLYLNSESYSLEQLMKISKLPMNVLEAVLKTLVTSRLLISSLELKSDESFVIPSDAIFTLTDEYELNAIDQVKVIKIPRIIDIIIVPPEIVKSTNTRLFPDIRHTTKAAIMRILKSNTSLEKVSLISLVQETLPSLSVSIEQIETCLDQLVGDDYIVHDCETNSYSYCIN